MSATDTASETLTPLVATGMDVPFWPFVLVGGRVMTVVVVKPVDTVCDSEVVVTVGAGTVETVELL